MLNGATHSHPSSQVKAVKAESIMWTSEHTWPMLPWSCVILQSVPEEETKMNRASPLAAAESAAVDQSIGLHQN